MAITLTNIATAGSAAGTASSLALVVPAGGVPAGSLIVVCAAQDVVQTDSVSDNGSTPNTYTTSAATRIAYNSNFRQASLSYAWNSNALVSGNTITWVPGANLNRHCAASAFYATGIETAFDPYDAAVKNSATGLDANPVVQAAAAPALANSLIVGVTGLIMANTAAYTQDSTNAAYQDFPVRLSNTVANFVTIAGGSVVSSSRLTYAPHQPSSLEWGIMIFGFKPYVAPIPPVEPPVWMVTA